MNGPMKDGMDARVPAEDDGMIEQAESAMVEDEVFVPGLMQDC